MKKIALFYKKEDPAIVKIKNKLVAEIKKTLKAHIEIEKVSDDSLVVSLGGDGTMLRAAKIAAKKDLPI